MLRETWGEHWSCFLEQWVRLGSDGVLSVEMRICWNSKECYFKQISWKSPALENLNIMKDLHFIYNSNKHIFSKSKNDPAVNILSVIQETDDPRRKQRIFKTSPRNSWHANQPYSPLDRYSPNPRDILAQTDPPGRRKKPHGTADADAKGAYV